MLVSSSSHPCGRSCAPFVAACGLLVALAPAPVGAQSPAQEGSAPPEVEEAIQWNFQPLQTSTELTEAALEARWAAPFAVESQGHPSPREIREVVVVRGRTEEVAADSGETAAVVEIEEGEGVGELVLQLSQAAEGAESAAPVDSAAREDSEAVTEGEASGGGQDTGSEESAALAEEAPQQRHTHIVARGDTLYGLARRYGVSADAIRGANDLESDVVRLGATLIIPDEEETLR